MHPLGIGLAFLAFGMVSGLGAFIIIGTLPALTRSLKATNMKLGIISNGYLSQSLVTFFYVGLFLLGIGLVVAGGYATYNVIYGLG